MITHISSPLPRSYRGLAFITLFLGLALPVAHGAGGLSVLRHMAQNLPFAQATGGKAVDDEGNMLLTLDVRELNMGEFAGLLSHSGTIQVVTSTDAAEKRLSVYLRNVSSKAALEAVCRSAGLVCRPNPDGITYVFTQKEFSASRGLYNDEVVETIQLRYATAADVGETLRNLFADRVVWIRPSDYLGDPEDRIDRALSRMDQLTDYEEFELGESGSGGDNDDDDDDDDDDNNRSNRNYGGSGAANLGMMEQYRNLLREQIPEHGPAAPGMEGGSPAAEAARFGIVFVSVFPSTNMLLLRSTDEKALEQIKNAVQDLDRPTPQVLLEVKVLEVDLGEGESTGVDWLLQAGDVYTGVSDWTDGSIQTVPSESTVGGLGTAISDQVTSTTGFNPRTTMLGLLSDHVIARIRLLETEGRLVQLATPTLLVANDEASRVFIGSQSKFLEEVKRSAVVISEGGQTTGGELEPELEEQSIGMHLLINPRIHADRSVTLRVLQEDTDFGETRTIDYGEGSFDVQDIEHRSVVSTVVAQDNSWVVIGGLIREAVSDKGSGIPVLRNIPLLGKAFSSNGKSRTRTELIILIRPLVLIAPGEEAPVSRALLERISQHPSRIGEDFPDLNTIRRLMKFNAEDEEKPGPDAETKAEVDQ